MAQKGTFIEFKGVTKIYQGGFKALDEISFFSNKGEIFGYIGPNGAGKTTTIKILVGLIKDYQGDVSVDGINLREKDFNTKLGYLPQDVGFQEWRTVDHALTTFGRLSGVPTEALEDRIASTLDLVGLHDVISKKIVNLSGGMVQKLRLAQALLHDPEILVLDEPMNGLDPASRFQVKNIIKSLAGRGKTVLFSSHILSDVQDIADTIGILNHGKIIRIGSPAELQAEFQVGNAVELEVVDESLQVADLETMSEIQSITTEEGRKFNIVFKPEIDLDVAIHSLLAFLFGAGVKLRHFNQVRPSLEEVYLKLVGGDGE